jgi:threonine dehydrogenase-like Zn-dependent dehydrogenase
MQALTVRPGVPDSLMLREVPEPPAEEGAVLIEGIDVGLCGTDQDIVNAEFGQAPPGENYLILGHENLGRVLEAPDSLPFSVGDLVVTEVRLPDPVPCAACAVGEWDRCLNGHYTEHGIVGVHGFARPRWRSRPESIFRLDPNLAKVGVLLEPTTVVAKAWEQIDRIGNRAFWQPWVVAVIGAGPLGLLAALLGVQRGLKVHVFDLKTSGLKPELVESVGATYHSTSLTESSLQPNIIIECSGAPTAVADALTVGAPGRVSCLIGFSAIDQEMAINIGALNLRTVLDNKVVVGSVNANRRHYDQAAHALASACPDWLARLITRRVPLAEFAEAFTRHPDDVKVVLDLQSAGCIGALSGQADA